MHNYRFSIINLKCQALGHVSILFVSPMESNILHLLRMEGSISCIVFILTSVDSLYTEIKLELHLRTDLG